MTGKKAAGKEAALLPRRPFALRSSGLGKKAAEKAVAFLGPRGTFSEEAALRYFGRADRPVATIGRVFEEVEGGGAEFGVVPVENSAEGSVTITNDLLVSFGGYVQAEIVLPVRHCLVCGKEKAKISKIITHPQALAQCRRFLSKHYPTIEVEETASTAIAVEKAVGQKGAAAIAGERAAKIYGARIVARNIEDRKDNSTRFFVVSSKKGSGRAAQKTSLVLSVAHVPGSLSKILNEFASRRINLTRIESRPLAGSAWEYVFFLDFEASPKEKRFAQALESVRQKCLFVKVLGSYPVVRYS